MIEKPNLPEKEPKEDGVQHDKERWGAILKAFGEGDFDHAEDLGATFDIEEPSSKDLEKERRKKAYKKGLETIKEERERREAEENDPFYGTVEKGSTKEILYRVLENDYPDLGVEVVNENEDFITEEPEKESVYVTIETNKNKRALVKKIREDFAINILTSELTQSKEIEEAKNRGLITTEDADKLLARVHVRKIEGYQRYGRLSEEGVEEEMQDSDVNPLTDEELRDLISKRIREIIEEQEKK